MSLLDDENVEIIGAMKKFGPRNLQSIARKSGVPYPTVYTRVNKLGTQGLLDTWTYPNLAKIGLARSMVLLTPTPGREVMASEALKILHEKKLDELPVVNEKGEPVGLLDVQDLLDVGVV